jgi:uncharacterized protein (DUF362 family)
MQLGLFPYHSEVVSEKISGEVHKALSCFLDEPEHVRPIFLKYLSSYSIRKKLFESSEIWIKPNLTSDSIPERGKTSQPKILKELLATLNDIGIDMTKVRVADSSVIGVDTNLAANVSGIAAICEDYKVSFVDLRSVEFVEVPIENARIFHKLPINRPFVQANNFLINLAKIKSTYGSPVGFSIKNNKGIITDDFKLNFHLRGVQDGLCDLYKTVKWDLTILEGFPASELGLPSWSGLLLISTSSILADVCAAILCKVDIRDVPHLDQISKDVGLVLNDAFTAHFMRMVPKLQFSKVGINDLENEFNIKVKGARVCSGCRESFFRALTRIKKDGSVKYGTYFLGACSHSEYPIIAGAKHIIGNCAIRSLDSFLANATDPSFNYQSALEITKVAGCPPTIDGMVKSLRAGEDDGRDVQITTSSAIEEALEIPSLQVAADATIHSSVLPYIPREHIDFTELGIEVGLACEVVTAAICHQMNWEFLRESIYDLTLKNHSVWEPANLGSISEKDIQRLLDGYSKSERIRPGERASMINNLSNIFCNDIKSYKDIFLVKDKLRTDFTEILKKSEVFSADPSEKKLQVLIHTLSHFDVIQGIGEFARPAIDYHIMRLYIRRGDISSINITGQKYITETKQRRVKTVLALRKRVNEALEYVANLSGLSIPQVNTIEWWIGRSVCKKLNPDCELVSPESNWLKPFFNKCPFSTTCYGYNCNNMLLNVHEPYYTGILF